jgi:LacI family transcriptional regulator
MTAAKQKRSVSRNDVARLAGVSSATVSYVINDGPRSVSAATRTKVLEAVEALGYQPNAIARNLRRQQSSTLGLIIPDTLNPYFAEVARGVEAVAFEHGYIVVLCHSHYSSEKENRYGDVLRTERVAGVIWIPASEDYEPASKFIDYQVPLVLLDRVLEHNEVPSVIADNFGGGLLATEYLISLGHRRIGFVRRLPPLMHSNERARGYRVALEKHGIPFDESLIVPGGYAFENGRIAGHALLERDAPPTAVFAYNDVMAIGVLRAAHECGLRVPEDLSVVGFDDIPDAAFTFPPLTTVRQPKLEMGRAGAEMLINLINRQEPPKEKRLTFDVHLIERSSTAPMIR